MDDTAQSLVAVGIDVLLLAGFLIWGIRELIDMRKQSTARKFEQVKWDVDRVHETLVRIDERMGRIECRLEHRSDAGSWEVGALRSDLANGRRELARIAAAAGDEANEARA